MLKIWIITHNAPPPEYDVRIRNKAMAKYLTQMGHDVTIFGASTIHNTDINLIDGRELFIEKEYEGLKFVHVKAPSYSGNGVARIKNLMVYPFNLWRITRKFDKPDVIINDLEVYAFDFPFKIARRCHCPIISEIRDLTPESIIVYGYLKRNSLLAKYLYHIEKNIYKQSDHIVFSMLGGYDYIRERNLDTIVPLKKVSFIGNGVDLEIFNANRERYQLKDDDLDDSRYKNIVYTGSIRKVNNVGLLLDIAKVVQTKDRTIRFLIWGSGDELEALKKRLVMEGIDNVRFKGRVEKIYIPYIVSRAYMNIAHNTPSEIFRYGISFNKMSDYFAAGKPIICDFPCPYNPALEMSAGIEVFSENLNCMADRIVSFVNVKNETYEKYCRNAIKAAEQYDYKELSVKMNDIIMRVYKNNDV